MSTWEELWIFGLEPLEWRLEFKNDYGFCKEYKRIDLGLQRDKKKQNSSLHIICEQYHEQCIYTVVWTVSMSGTNSDRILKGKERDIRKEEN